MSNAVFDKRIYENFEMGKAALDLSSTCFYMNRLYRIYEKIHGPSEEETEAAIIRGVEDILDHFNKWKESKDAD